MVDGKHLGFAGSFRPTLYPPPPSLCYRQDALSAEITARRRNALRLAEVQTATTEGERESAVQMASGMRVRCLELEELVARLTRDVRTAQEDLSSQVSLCRFAYFHSCTINRRLYPRLVACRLGDLYSFTGMYLFFV